MRRFVTTSMFIPVVLLACGVCFAQDKNPDAAGAKTESPDMWEAYKKMWEGKWETTITMPMDVPGTAIKKGDRFTGTMTDEVIVNGNGLLVTRIFRNPNGEVVVEQKGLASWCPKQKAILLHEVSTIAGRTEGVIKMVDGQEQHASTEIDAQGQETAGCTVTTSINENANQIKVTEGPYKGFEMTWKRKKG